MTVQIQNRANLQVKTWLSYFGLSALMIVMIDLRNMCNKKKQGWIVAKIFWHLRLPKNSMYRFGQLGDKKYVCFKVNVKLLSLSWSLYTKW